MYEHAISTGGLSGLYGLQPNVPDFKQKSADAIKLRTNSGHNHVYTWSITVTSILAIVFLTLSRYLKMIWQNKDFSKILLKGKLE